MQAADQAATQLPLATLVLADHGEALEQSTRWHARNLSEELLHIPLILRAPGVGAGKSTGLVSSIDVAASILALTQTPVPDWMQGRDLSTAGGERGPIFSDTWLPAAGISLTAAYDGQSKLVYSHGSKTYAATSQLDVPSPEDHPALRRAIDRYLSENELNFSDLVLTPSR